MAIETPDILGNFLRGQQAGEGQRRKDTLAKFLQPALGGDQNALSQVYGVDPDAGLQVQGLAQRQSAADQDQKMGQLEVAARAWRAASPEMRQQLYPGIAELTESVLPQFAGKIPREYSPAYEANIDKFLSGFAGQDEQFTLAPGSARYDASGRVVASQPFAPDKPQFQVDADGNGFWIAPGQAPRPVDAPSIGAPSSNYQDIYAAIAGRHGSAVTSGVRPVLPGVGAGANSQHPKGTAADFRTNGLAPQQVEALMGDLRGQGFEVIDERDNRNGRGPHIHAELPPGGIKFPTKGNASTEDKAANWQIVQGQDGTFYRVNKLTGETASAGVQGANALRMQDQHQKRADAVAGIEGAIRSTDETIRSLNLLLTHPGRGAGTGMSALLPAVPGSDRKNFDAQLATFKAQTFIPMVSQLKGMGALSDAEGKKLMDAVGAIDPQMSEGEFAASLNRIKAQLLRAQTAAYKKIGQLNTNQAPAAAPSAAPAANRPQLPPGFSWED